jgi:hypothetical protein
MNKEYIFSGKGNPIMDADADLLPSDALQQVEEMKIRLREKDAQIKVLKSLIKK